MNEINRVAIRERIATVARQQGHLADATANDVAFHLTDWLDDLETYARFCAQPGKMSDAEVNRMLIEWLVHVPNHVAAASKLYTGVPVTDVFGVGATSEEA